MAKSNDTSAVLERLLTRDEVARYLGISVATVDNYRKKGQLRSVKYGKFLRFRESDIRQYIENHTR